MKIVANLVLCAIAFAAMADAKSMRRATSCDSGVTPAPVVQKPVTPGPTTPSPGDQKPVTPGPSTPASSTPASSTPASSTPASSTPASSTPASSTPASSTPASSTPASSTPASSTPASSTPASSTPASSTPASSTPASSTPASSTPASSTPASSTPASSTPAPSSAAPGQWDLSQGYADDCEGFLRVRPVGSTAPLLQTGCVLQFNWKHPKSFTDTALVVDPGCFVCDGKFEDLSDSNSIRLCKGKPFCPNFYHYYDVTQADLLCVAKNNGTTSVEATGPGECALADN